MLREAEAMLAGSAPERIRSSPVVVVVGDTDGSLTLAAASRLRPSGMRVFTDALDAERLVSAAVRRADCPIEVVPADAELARGADLILIRIPKANDELAYVAGLVAEHAPAHAVLLAGERDKHLRRAHTTTLEAGFERVRATLGLRKARALVASEPRGATAGGVSVARIDERELSAPIDVEALGGVFAGAKLDLGTRSLLTALPDALNELGLGSAERGGKAVNTGVAGVAASDQPLTVLDLGCGTGILAIEAARRIAGASVIASDRSWIATESARRTIERNGLADRIRVVRDLGASSLPDASVNLILCNPPFHDGRAVERDLAGPIFEDAGRVLAPGGAMVTVFNSHLGHRQRLERHIGPTRQIARDPRFTITLSRARRRAVSESG